MTKTVLAFGEVLWDLLPTGPALGGAPFNFVYRVNTLGHCGLMISRLGRDDYGRRAMERVERLGMDPRLIQWDDSLPTGTVNVDLSRKDSPDYFIVPDVAYDRIEFSETLMQAAASADCLCFGTLIQRAPVSRATLDRLLEAADSAVKLLDLNLRKNCSTTETITASLEKADILKLNEDEARFLASLFSLPGDSLIAFGHEILRRRSLSLCLITLGERGVLAVSREGETVYAPGFRVEVADTCGSGDAFTAGFLAQWFRARGLSECCEFGCALGALVASQAGATTPIAPAEIEAFQKGEHPRISDPSLEPYWVQ